MPLQLTILVPAFNEAHRLAEGMRRLDGAISAGAVDLDRTEVVVIDDGSTDATAAVAEKLLAPLPHHRVVRLPSNAGKGAAVRAGVAASRSPFTAFMDADMAIDPRAVPYLIEGLRRDDVVIGSRALRDSMVETSYVFRTIMGRMFNGLVTAGTGLPFHDTQCGFKAFRTPAARLLFHLVRIDRFAFDVEVLVRARRLGLRISEVPVHWTHVDGSTVHPVHDSLSMMADVYRSRRGILAVPPVASLSVRPTDATADLAGIVHQARTLLDPILDAAPLPIVVGPSEVTVLCALVEPAAVARAQTALDAGIDRAEVTRRALSLDDLVRLGPLGRGMDAGLRTDP